MTRDDVKLLICFPGMAHKFLGLEPDVFVASLEDSGVFEEITVFYPEYTRWPDEGFQENEFQNWMEIVNEISAAGKRLYFFGVSIGGFAAIRMAAATEAEFVLAVMPPFDLTGLRNGKGGQIDFRSLSTILRDLPRTQVIYSEDDEGTAHNPKQALEFAGHSQITVDIEESFSIRDFVESGEFMKCFGEQ